MNTFAIRCAAAAAVICLGVLAVGSQAEVVQSGNLRVGFNGEFKPRSLPRHGVRPVAVSLGGNVTTTDGAPPPQLRGIQMAINRHGRLDYQGLPACRLEQIQPSTSRSAMQACGRSKVGEGRFYANVSIPGQAPFPSRGRLIAFNGVEGGRPVIFAHVYGTEPVPTSYTIPFRIGHTRGTFGATLTASLPKVTGRAGYITGIELNLHRNYRYRGAPRSYLSAGCPAPAGIDLAPFNFARAKFTFPHRILTIVVQGNCRARDRPLGGSRPGAGS